MPRGGRREGAGAKPKWRSGKTRVMRIPEELAEQVLEIIQALDEGKSIQIEQLESVNFPSSVLLLDSDNVTESKVIDLSRIALSSIQGKLAVGLEDLVKAGYDLKPTALLEKIKVGLPKK